MGRQGEARTRRELLYFFVSIAVVYYAVRTTGTSLLFSVIVAMLAAGKAATAIVAVEWIEGFLRRRVGLPTRSDTGD